MIAELFKNLLKIEGVEAVAVFSNDNKLLDSWTRSHFNPQVFRDLGLNSLQICQAGKRSNLMLEEIVLKYEKGQLYCRSNPDFLLVVVTKVKVDITLIRLIVNVGLGEYRESRKLQKIVRKVTSGSTNILAKELIDDVEEEYLTKLNLLEETS